MKCKEASLKLGERLEKFDRKLLVISAFGMLFFGGILMKDDAVVTLIKRRQQGEVIGHVMTTKNDVRRRTGRSLTWYGAKKKEELYEQDSLYTGSDSGLSVELLNLQTLDVESNSLVVLRTKGNTLLLDLKIGGISTSVGQNQKIKVLHDGEITEVNAGKMASPISIRKNTKGSLTVSSHTGDVEVKKGNKKAIIKKNETKTVEQVVSLAMPEPEPELILESPMTFSEDEIESLSLEKTPIQEPKLEEPPKELPPLLARGMIPSPMTPEQKVILQFKPDADLRSPASIEESILNPPRLEWQPVGNALNYSLEIAKTENFERPITFNSLAMTEMTWKGAKPGKYFWRVKAHGERGDESQPGEAAKLSVELPSPALSVPDIKTELTEVPSDLIKEKQIKIPWSKVPMANGYRFIASIGDKVGKGQILKTNAATVKVPSNKSVKLKVFVVDETGEPVSRAAQGEFSFKRELLMKTPTTILPDDNSTVMALDKKQIPPILFAWQKDKAAQSYDLQFASDPNFKIVLNEKTMTTNEFLLKEQLANAQTYWRVRSRYQTYKSEWSKPRSFAVKTPKR
jgi:hypothetical protein